VGKLQDFTKGLKEKYCLFYIITQKIEEKENALLFYKTSITLIPIPKKEQEIKKRKL
jgi:hypothetical protein